MNEIVKKFFLAGDTFMPEMFLRQSGFIYGACGPFTKNKESVQKFKETGDSRYINRNELEKLPFNMIWLMEILKIYPEEQLLKKFYTIKQSISLKIQNMMKSACTCINGLQMF